MVLLVYNNILYYIGLSSRDLSLSPGFCSATFFYFSHKDGGCRIRHSGRCGRFPESRVPGRREERTHEGWRLHILMARNNYGFLLLLGVVDFMVLVRSYETFVDAMSDVIGGF